MIGREKIIEWLSQMQKMEKKGVKMSKRNRILGAGLDVLMSAHKEGATRSREIDKEKGIDNKFIYAEVSYKNHKNNWRQFSKWANENGLKRVGQITQNDVEKYVRECAENGLSKKTIESRIGAINKVMLASERWNNENRVILGKIDGITVKKLPTKVYKDLTAKEWQDRNPKQYENNRELIDTVQAFGLRRREVRELNSQSFLIDEKGKMYVQTVGKGNKYRIAPVCDSEMNEQMRERWGDKAIPLQQANEERFRRVLRDEDQRLNLKGANGHNFGLHIHRNEYTQRYLRERVEQLEEQRGGVERSYKGYSHLKTRGKSLDDLDAYSIKIGTFEGSARAFMEVSRALGHNRLDVLAKYLNS